jgi:hypothetical protein
LIKLETNDYFVNFTKIQESNCNWSKGEKKISINKGPIAKCQNIKGQIEMWPFPSQNGVVSNLLFIPFLAWNRGSHLQKRKCWPAKTPSSQSMQNVNQMVYHNSQANPVSFNQWHASGVRIKTHHQQSDHGRTFGVLVPTKN